jgi:arylsulfatase A-like enzyme
VRGSRVGKGTIVALLLMAMCSCGDRPSSASKQSADHTASAPAASRILVTIESVAASRLALYGGSVPTPSLAGLAARGAVYDDAVSVTPLSRPALVTILTGIAPDRSGVRDNIHDALPDTFPTVAEGARGAGFETAAFVGTPFASYSSGLQRGFDLFDGPEALVVGPAQHAPPVVPAGQVADHFKQWLATRAAGKPFFAWIHFADLNGQATPAPSSVSKGVVEKDDYPLKPYDDALAAIDAAIGSIVEAVGKTPGGADVSFLAVGTHGAYLGESGRHGDAFWLADETLRVPVVEVPRLGATPADAPARLARQTWLPDVARTLAGAVGATLSPDADGVPLGQAPDAARSRLAWGFAPDDQLGWPPLTGLDAGTNWSVFECAADGTLRPRGADGTPVPPAVAARPARPRPRTLPAENRRAIAHAGLKLGAVTSPAVPSKDVDAWLADLQLMRVFFGIDRPRPAMRRTKALLDASPDALPALTGRLYALVSSQSPERETLRDRLLARYPARSEALHWSAHVSIAEKKTDEAGALLDAAVAVGPVEPEMRYDLACVDSLRGNLGAALKNLDAALSSGYRNWDWIDKDPDLVALRASPGFVDLLRAHGR